MPAADLAPRAMPEGLVACVPNVSEGRRSRVIDLIASAARRAPGVRLLDIHSDPDHNRSVLTLIGPADAIGEAAFRIAQAAVEAIDMREHQGVHPRIGALDVLPFVPLGDTWMQTCVELAHRVGRRIAESLDVPVYFYGEAALRPQRRLLVDIRRGQYEELRTAIATDPARAPDVGPASLGPAGATAVGARPILVAFNLHLRTPELAVARAIARTLRASGGGLPGVQALGLPTSDPELVQVSMNLTDLEATSLQVAVGRVRAEAERLGVEVAHGELVGLMPARAALASRPKTAQAELVEAPRPSTGSGGAVEFGPFSAELLDAVADVLGLPSLSRRQVLELAIEDALR